METEFRTNLHDIWDKIDIPEKRQRDGFLWGQQYLDGLITELVFAKQNAKKENDPYLYNQLRTSLIRAHEVKAELESKIKNS
jgi:hypothetical protein